MKYLLAVVLSVGLAVLITGCGRGEDTSVEKVGGALRPGAQARAATEAPPALSAVFAPVSPQEELLPIPELRKTVTPGDEVVLEAKVMGTEKPFVDNRAVLVVGDEGTLTSCDLRHADQCPTPWDNCCDDPAAVRAGTATIQVVDEEGNVLRHGLKGVSGLEELSRLRIAGEVAPGSTEAALIINASGIELL